MGDIVAIATIVTLILTIPGAVLAWQLLRDRGQKPQK